MMNKKILLIILVVMMISMMSYAVTYYIGDNGDPASPGYGTWDINPYPDFNTAFNAALTVIEGEDVTIFYLPGYYDENISLSNVNLPNTLTIKGTHYSTGMVSCLTGRYIRADYGIKLFNCSNISIRDISVFRYNKAGIYIVSSDDIEVEYVTVDGCGEIADGNATDGWGIKIENSYDIDIMRNWVRYCGVIPALWDITNNSGGLFVNRSSKCRIIDNEIYFNKGPAYHFLDSNELKVSKNAAHNLPEYNHLTVDLNPKYIRNAGLYYENCYQVEMDTNFIKDCLYGLATYNVYDFYNTQNTILDTIIKRYEKVSPEFETALFDFEAGEGTDAPGWTRGAYTNRVPTNSVNDGGYSLDVYSSLITSSITNDYIPVKPDTLYTLSAYVFVALFLDTIYLDLDMGQGEGGDFANGCAYADGNRKMEWQPVSVKFRTGPDTTGIKIRIVGNGHFWVDDVRVRRCIEESVVYNPGFEDGTGETAALWSKRTGVTRDGSMSNTGDYALRISHPTTAYVSSLINVPVKPNTMYTLSGEVFINYAHGDVKLSIYPGHDVPGRFPHASVSADGSKTGIWQTMATTFTTGDFTGSVKILLRGSGDLWFDDIAITEVVMAEQVVNAGFEAGDTLNALDWIEGWQSTRNNERCRTGDFSLKVNSEPITSSFVEKLIPVSPDTTYMLKGYINVKQANSAIYLDLFGTPGTGGTFNMVQVHASLDDAYRDEWQPVEGVFTTGIDTTQLMIRIVGAGEFWVDDISLQRVE